MKKLLTALLLLISFSATAQTTAWSTSPTVTPQTRKLSGSNQIRWIWGTNSIFSLPDSLGKKADSIRSSLYYYAHNLNTFYGSKVFNTGASGNIAFINPSGTYGVTIEPTNITVRTIDQNQLGTLTGGYLAFQNNVAYSGFRQYIEPTSTSLGADQHFQLPNQAGTHNLLTNFDTTGFVKYPVKNTNTNSKTDIPNTYALYGATDITTALVAPSVTGNLRNDQSATVELQDGSGRFMIAITHFGAISSDASAAVLYKAFSTDRGRTWGTPVLLQDTLAGGHSVQIASFYVKPSNQHVIMLYFARYSTTVPVNSAIYKTEYSADMSTIISGPTQIVAPTAYNVPNSDRIFIDNINGRLLYPYGVLTSTATTGSSTISTYQGRLLTSSDNGDTWSDNGLAVTGVYNSSGFGGVLEPGIYYTPGQGLIYYYRTLVGTVWANTLTYSAGTYSAGAAFSTNLPVMNSGIDIKYVAKKNMLIAGKTRLIGTSPTTQANKLFIDLSMSNTGLAWNDIQNVASVPAGQLVNLPILHLDTLTDNLNVAYSTTSVLNTHYSLFNRVYPASYLNAIYNRYPNVPRWNVGDTSRNGLVYGRGTSIMAGYGTPVIAGVGNLTPVIPDTTYLARSSRLIGFRYTNNALSGRTTQQITVGDSSLYSQRYTVPAPTSPNDILLLECRPNDAFHDSTVYTPALYHAAVDSVVVAAHSRGWAYNRICLYNGAYFNPTTGNPTAPNTEYRNALFAAQDLAVATARGTLYFDDYTYFRAQWVINPNLLDSRVLHPTNEGNKLMSTRLSSFLAPYLSTINFTSNNIQQVIGSQYVYGDINAQSNINVRNDVAIGNTLRVTGNSYFTNPVSVTALNATLTPTVNSSPVIVNNLGIAGGSTIVGGTAASENLTLSSTSHATKGSIIADVFKVDEVNHWGAFTKATSQTAAQTADEALRLVSSTIPTNNTTHATSPILRLLGGIYGSSSASLRGLNLQVVGISGTNFGYTVNFSTTDKADWLKVTGTSGAMVLGANLSYVAGTTTIAPSKFTSGPLLTSPVAGSEEFLTDKRYFTIGTGTARKEYAFFDAAGTSGRVPYETTNGRLTDASSFTFDGSLLTAAMASASTAVTQAAANNSTNLSTTAYSDRVKIDNQLSKSANYTVLTGDWVAGKNSSLDLEVDATSGNITITLPSAANIQGYTVYVTKIDASANTVTINTTSGGNTLTAQWQSRTFKSNGTTISNR